MGQISRFPRPEGRQILRRGVCGPSNLLGWRSPRIRKPEAQGKGA